MLIESFSPEDTMGLAYEMGCNARPGDIYCLSGPLGAGKTAFAQGFARGLGFTGLVVSPTFTILNICEGGRMPLYHFDLYRLEGAEDLAGIGYEEFFYGQGCSLVEWAEIAEDAIPPEACWIQISPDLERGNNFRRIEITNHENTSN